MRRLAAAIACLLLAACAGTAPGWQLGQIERMTPTQVAATPAVSLDPQQRAALARLDAQILAEQERALAREATERALDRAAPNWYWGMGRGGWPGHGWSRPAYGWGPRPGWSLGWAWYPR